MKKIIFIGKSGCGKTTLSQAIQGLDFKYKKTQAVCHSGTIVDTPGEFIENRRFFSALLVSSNNCDVIGFVQDSTAKTSIFPPNFATMFNKEVVGIISKSALTDSNVDRSVRFLKMAGVKQCIETSTLENIGISRLISFLS